MPAWGDVWPGMYVSAWVGGSGVWVGEGVYLEVSAHGGGVFPGWGVSARGGVSAFGVVYTTSGKTSKQGVALPARLEQFSVLLLDITKNKILKEVV